MIRGIIKPPAKIGAWAFLLAAAVSLPQIALATTDSVRLAMEQEMERTMNQLSLEGLSSPCFVGYTISDALTFQCTATLGAVESSDLEPQRRARVRLLVGSLKLSNENYMYSGSWTAGDDIPLDDSRRGIRQVLWKLSDARYKEHAEDFEKKLAAIAQQNLAPEDTALPDLSDEPVLNFEQTAAPARWQTSHWENLARRLSAIFKEYPLLQGSRVSLYLYQADIRYLNSQGTWARYPLTLGAVIAECAAQADDGREMVDRLEFFARTPEEFESEQSLAQGIRRMAETMSRLVRAPLFEESYAGPVLFEEQALAELLAAKFFLGDAGLRAKRKNILDPSLAGSKSRRALDNPLEARLGKKVISRELSITDIPGLANYEGRSLIGSFAVDAEGVRPPEELVLVEKGVLRNLLNGRTPTQRIGRSNGHKRLELTANGLAEEIGPSVVKIEGHKTTDYRKLKEKLIKAARSEDLDYAYVVRKVARPSGGLSRNDEEPLPTPVEVIRVSAKDGSETLVRGAEITGLSLSALKRVLGISRERYVHNTMIGSQGTGRSWGWGLRGVPASFIIPKALLLEEVEMSRERKAVTVKLPPVPNPLP